MGAITRQEMEVLEDPLIVKKKKRKPDLVGYFLHLFEGDEPLQLEAVESLRDEVVPTPAEHIRECFEEAEAEGWIEERDGEFFITEEGKQKAADTVPLEP